MTETSLLHNFIKKYQINLPIKKKTHIFDQNISNDKSNQITHLKVILFS